MYADDRRGGKRDWIGIDIQDEKKEKKKKKSASYCTLHRSAHVGRKRQSQYSLFASTARGRKCEASPKSEQVSNSISYK